MDRYDSITPTSHAIVSARSQVNWDQEARDFYGKDYDRLPDKEKEMIRGEIENDWDRSTHFYS